MIYIGQKVAEAIQETEALAFGEITMTGYTKNLMPESDCIRITPEKE